MKLHFQRAELRRRVEDHFREVSASLPYYKRVKVLQFTDIELPDGDSQSEARRSHQHPAGA